MDLFSSKSLDQEFNGRWIRIERDLREMDEEALADPTQIGRVIEREAGTGVPQLHREKATFPLETQGTSTVVTLRVPYAGDSSFFHLAVPGAGPALLDATPVGGQTWDRPEGAPTELLFRQAFPAGTSAADIKRWAKNLVDRTEEHLRALRAEVEPRAVALRSRAHEYAETRLAGLRTERTLAEGLGEGI